MSVNPNGITSPTNSFAGLPVCTRLGELEADIALIGIHTKPTALHRQSV